MNCTGQVDTRVVVSSRIEVKNAIARKSNKASTIKLSIVARLSATPGSTMMNDSRNPSARINRLLQPLCLFFNYFFKYMISPRVYLKSIYTSTGWVIIVPRIRNYDFIQKSFYNHSFSRLIFHRKTIEVYYI